MGFSVPHTKGLQIACLHIIQSRNLLVEDKGNTISSGAQFTNDFSITIQIQWKFHFGVAVVLFPFIVPQQTYVHTMTMQLSCHVQKFTVISLLEFGWEQRKIFLEFWLAWKNRWVKWVKKIISEMGPKIISEMGPKIISEMGPKIISEMGGWCITFQIWWKFQFIVIRVQIK